jgi:hypothetical protein
LSSTALFTRVRRHRQTRHPPARNRAPAPPSADSLVQDDLVSDNWVYDCNCDHACARTVGNLRRGIEKWYSRVPLSAQFCPVVFLAKDGRLYTADTGVIVRPATPDEVREAVEGAKELESDTLEDRFAELDGYLGQVGA